MRRGLGPPSPFGAKAAGVVDLRDVGVVERRERLGFARKPHQPIGIGREALGQHLQRDVAIELAVARTIDLSHAAFAELRHDLIEPDARARSDWGA